MSQPNRKRPHQQSPPRVKEEQQEQEENTHSIRAGINGNASQCSSSNFDNTNHTSQDGNGGDDINELKLKMVALEAKNQILEGRLAYQELRARQHAISEEAVLANLKQENRALWMRLNEMEHNAQTQNKKANKERNQQQPNANMSDCVVVNMPESESQENLDNSDELLRLRAPESRHWEKTTLALIPLPPSSPPKAVVLTPDPVPCHSANLSDCLNMLESHSHGSLNTLDDLDIWLRQQAILAAAAVAALVPPPAPMSVAPNSVPCHSTQSKVLEAKRLCNPLGNGWNPSTGKATMKVSLPDQLIVHNSSPQKWGSIVARKGFLLAAFRQLQQNFFAGPILYYYEIATTSSSKHNESRLCIGLSVGSVQKGTCLGRSRTANTYAMQDDKCDYCLISGEARFLEWPLGAVKPKWTGTGCEDVFGCGLVLSADDKLAIFFTTNGILMGKQIAIDHHASSILYPTVGLNRDVTVEANFGQKPFKYNIHECPGLQFQW